MTKILTTEQIEKFERDGYVYPIDVLSSDEAAGYFERLVASEALQRQQLVKGANFKPHPSDTATIRKADSMAPNCIGPTAAGAAVNTMEPRQGDEVEPPATKPQDGLLFADPRTASPVATLTSKLRRSDVRRKQLHRACRVYLVRVVAQARVPEPVIQTRHRTEVTVIESAETKRKFAELSFIPQPSSARSGDLNPIRKRSIGPPSRG